MSEDMRLLEDRLFGELEDMLDGDSGYQVDTIVDGDAIHNYDRRVERASNISVAPVVGYGGAGFIIKRVPRREDPNQKANIEAIINLDHDQFGALMGFAELYFNQKNGLSPQEQSEDTERFSQCSMINGNIVSGRFVLYAGTGDGITIKYEENLGDPLGQAKVNIYCSRANEKAYLTALGQILYKEEQ